MRLTCPMAFFPTTSSSMQTLESSRREDFTIPFHAFRSPECFSRAYAHNDNLNTPVSPHVAHQASLSPANLHARWCLEGKPNMFVQFTRPMPPLLAFCFTKHLDGERERGLATLDQKEIYQKTSLSQTSEPYAFPTPSLAMLLKGDKMWTASGV